MVSGELLLLVMLGADLTPMQRDVLIDLTLLERSMDEIAFHYGVTRNAVSQAAARGRQKIARKLERDRIRAEFRARAA